MEPVIKMKFFVWSVLLMHGASGVEIDRVSVSVMEGDSVTLHTDVKTKQRDRIRWYFNDTRIAQITGDLSKTCTDVQCNEGTERFRDRLKLDHQTGSLTIMNITNTDSGDYHLETIISGSISEKIFSVTITGESLCLKAVCICLNHMYFLFIVCLCSHSQSCYNSLLVNVFTFSLSLLL
ncbi:hypothetical protein cypCar_00040400 [Cyprinus carpio]|nr:hypothetical protein cypCar_00040400 [Cyprinus carpio]